MRCSADNNQSSLCPQRKTKAYQLQRERRSTKPVRTLDALEALLAKSLKYDNKTCHNEGNEGPQIPHI